MKLMKKSNYIFFLIIVSFILAGIPNLVYASYAASFTGRVVDGQGQGVNQVTVQILLNGTHTEFATSYTNTQGYFDFSHIMSSGSYYARVSKSGYTSQDSVPFTLSVIVVGYIIPDFIAFGNFQIRGYPVVNIHGPYYGMTSSPIQFSSVGTYDPDSSNQFYSWNFGDGQFSFQANPTHAYKNQGTYYVMLTVTDELGLERYLNTTASISSNPPISIPNGPYYAEANDIVIFNGSESYDDGSIIDYRWDFTDGSNYNYGWNATHIYTEPGVFTVKLMVTDNHNATATNTTTVYITAKPPIIEINGPYADFVTDPIQFSSAGTYDIDGIITEYVWTFGDGTNSTEPNPNHTYVLKGNYTVTLTVKDNHNATTFVSTYADILPKPPVAQIADIPLVNSGEIIQFTSSSYDSDNNIVEYRWNFGDGSSTSFEENPTHSYESPGDYTVTLTVVDEDGLDHTVPMTINIENIDPTAEIVPPGSLEAESSSVFRSEGSEDIDGSIISYFWEFGDGETSSKANPDHKYMVKGSYSVTLTVTDDFEGTGTLTITIEVAPKPFPAIYVIAAIIISAAVVEYYFLVVKKK